MTIYKKHIKFSGKYKNKYKTLPYCINFTKNVDFYSVLW